MNMLTACWTWYMSSNVYVLIFLLLYSIELNIGVRPAYIRIIVTVVNLQWALGRAKAIPVFETVVPVVASS